MDTPRLDGRHSIETIRNNAKGYFFAPDTMRFFKSRVDYHVFCGPCGVFFCTSEKGPNGIRAYTVRQYHETWTDRSISTAGQFQQFRTLRAARNAAEHYALHGVPVTA